MTAPIPPALAGLPHTDAINQEFARQDGATVISNAFAAKDAGLALPFIRTFGRPDGMPVAWQWETQEINGQVQAYPEIKAPGSRKPWDAPSDTDTPRQLSGLLSLVADLDFDIEASGSCNAAFDLWLLKDPNGGPESIAAEIMVWLHMQGDIRPAGGDAVECPDLGVTLYKRSLYDAGGQPWPIYTYLPDTSDASGKIDLAAMIGTLVKKGLVSGDWWLSAVEFGNEVIDGAGWTVVNKFEVKIE